MLSVSAVIGPLPASSTPGATQETLNLELQTNSPRVVGGS